jgi:hypothetical protein
MGCTIHIEKHAEFWGIRTRSRGLMHYYDVASIERNILDIAGIFPKSKRLNQPILTAMNNFI